MDKGMLDLDSPVAHSLASDRGSFFSADSRHNRVDLQSPGHEPGSKAEEGEATDVDAGDGPGDLIDGSSLSPERKQQVRRSIRFEDNYPYYRRFMNGPHGTLWLRRVLPIRDMTPEQVEALNNSMSVRPAPGFDVFDGQGRYLGIVKVPDEMPLGLLNGDRMFGIVKDELDVEYLRIYRIEGMDADEADDA